MKQQGFTLIELMVYLLITAIIGTLSTMIFIDSVKFSNASKHKVQAIMDTGEAFMYLAEDIERTGIKVGLNGGVMTTNANVNVSP